MVGFGDDCFGCLWVDNNFKAGNRADTVSEPGKEGQSKQFKQLQILPLMPCKRSMFATITLSSASSRLHTGRGSTADDGFGIASAVTCAPPNNEASIMSFESLV